MEQNREQSLEESINQLMPSLPRPIQAFFAHDELTPIIRIVVAENGLRIDQGTILEREVIMMLLGIDSPAVVEQALREEAQIQGNVIQKIFESLNAKIFMPLRQKMQQGGGEVPKERPTAPVRPPAAPVPNYAAPRPAVPMTPRIPMPAPALRPTLPAVPPQSPRPAPQAPPAPMPPAAPARSAPPPPNLPGAFPEDRGAGMDRASYINVPPPPPPPRPSMPPTPPPESFLPPLMPKSPPPPAPRSAPAPQPIDTYSVDPYREPIDEN